MRNGAVRAEVFLCQRGRGMERGAPRALLRAPSPARGSAPCAPVLCQVPLLDFPGVPGNLFSVITKYKHDNLGPNAYRRL